MSEQIEKIIAILQSYCENQTSFTLSIDDPSGNSYIENLCAPKEDPQIITKYYERTVEQEKEIGLPVAENEEQQEVEEEFELNQQVHVFPGNCSRCNTPSETKMHMLGTFDDGISDQ